MEQLGSSIATLADARSALLQRAAQDPSDADSLEAASILYRDSIVQLRRAVAALREELGAEQANAIVGSKMMSQNMTVSERVLPANFLAKCEPSEPEQRASHGLDSTSDNSLFNNRLIGR